MTPRRFFQYLYTCVGAFALAGAAFLAMAATQADPALASSGINAALYSYACTSHSSASCSASAPGIYPSNFNLNSRDSTACADLVPPGCTGNVWSVYYPTTSGQSNPEEDTTQGLGGPCGLYWYAYVEGSAITTSTTNADGNAAVGTVFTVNQWFFISFTGKNGVPAPWDFSDTAPSFIAGYPQDGTSGGDLSYPNGNPYSASDVMGFSIDGHATVWVGFEDPDLEGASGWTPTTNCADWSPIWADQQPTGGASIMDLYTDSTPPPNVSSPTDNLSGAGTNLNSSSPTLQWDFTGVTDLGDGNDSSDPNDYYASGTQYYSYTTWLDQNNTNETGPPTGSPQYSGTIGAGGSGYATTCSDGGSCTFSSSEVALGYTAHFCIDDIVDWLANTNSTPSCGYYTPSNGAVTLTPASQTDPITQSSVLVASSTGAQQGESLILEDNTTGINTVYQSPTDICSSSATTLSTALTTSGAITTLHVHATSSSIAAGDTIYLSNGSNNQIFIASAAASSGATSILVNSQTPNYAYPATSTSAADASDLTIGAGEEFIMPSAGNSTCTFLASPVGDGTYSFSDALYNTNNPTSYSATASASITWEPWSVSLAANSQTSLVELGTGTVAQLVATANLTLSSPPGTQELEIFAANSAYTPSGSALLTCTTGVACPTTSYLSQSQPGNTSSDCISETYLDSCFVAEILGPGSVVLATSDLEVEWEGSGSTPSAPDIEAATSPGQALVGSQQSFWVVSPSSATVDNYLPETQTIVAGGVTYTFTPEYTDWYFGDNVNNSGNDALLSQNVNSDCSSATANLSPNTCTYGNGYGTIVTGNNTSSITHTYEEATSGVVGSTPSQCTTSTGSGSGYQWCAVLNWNVTGSNGYNGTAESISPTYSLQVAQLQGQYSASSSCALSITPGSGEAMAGTSLSLTASNCPGGINSYQFQYEQAGGTGFTTIQPWGTSATDSSWSTASLSPGEYYIQLQASDTANSPDDCASGDIACESITDYYVLNGCTVNSLYASLSSPQAAQTPIALNASATCATGTPQYQFSYSGQSSGTIQTYSTTPSATWNTVTENLPAGSYTVTVSVYSSSYSSSTAVSQSIHYTIGGVTGTCTSSSLSSSPTSSAQPGVQVTLSASVTCPSGTYPSYAFFYSVDGSSTLNPIPATGDGWTMSPTATWNTTGLATSSGSGGNPYTLTLEISSTDGTTRDSGSDGIATESFTLSPWTLSASQSVSSINTGGTDTLTTTSNGSLTDSGLTTTLYSAYPDYNGTVVADSPICAWQLSENSGSTANAIFGTSCSGSYANIESGGYNDTPGPLSGNSNQGGIDFDGSNGAVTTSVTSVTNSSSYTLWFKTLDTNQGLLTLKSSSVIYGGLWINSSGYLCAGAYNSTYNEECTTSAVDTGAWEFATYTDSPATGLSLYLNGTLIGTNMTNPGLGTGSVTLYPALGYFSSSSWANYPSNSYYGGIMADVAWFSSALTESEVGLLYSAGTNSAATVAQATCTTGTTCSDGISLTSAGYYSLYGTINTSPITISNILTLYVSPVCSSPTLNASPTSSQGINESVVLTATASCSSGATAQYAFFYTPSGGSLTQIQAMGNSGTATWDTNGLSAGSYTLTVEVEAQGASSVQASTYISYALTLDAQSITFTSTAPTTGVITDTYTPTATASSGLVVTITLDSSSSGCTLTSGVVTFTAIGTCKIDANQAGNSQYSAAPQVQQSIAVSMGNIYTAISPTVRMVDTRTGATDPSTYAGQTLASGGTFTFQVSGVDGVPNTATSVALQIAATNTTSAGNIIVYPAGTTRPNTSSVNWAAASMTVGNLVITQIGSNGEVSVYNSAGTVDLTVDLQGYFSPATSSAATGSYVPVSGARLCDTRSSTYGCYSYSTNGATGDIAAASSMNLQVTGAGGIPSSGVADVILQITVTNNTTAGYGIVYPQGTTKPSTSNLDWAAAQTVGNRVIVPVGSTGEISIYASVSTAVLVDVTGYFETSSGSSTAASLYRSVSPVRLIDTRTGGSGLEGAGDTLGTTAWAAQIAGLSGSNIPVNADALVSNVTVISPSSGSYLTIYPGGTAPTTTDMNWAAAAILGNLSIAQLSSTGTLDYLNALGTANITVDAFGYFVPGSDSNGDCTSASLASNGSTWQGTTETLTATSAGTNCSSAVTGEAQYQFTETPSGGTAVILETGDSNTYSFNLNTLVPKSYTYGVTVSPYSGGTGKSATVTGTVNTYATDVKDITSADGITTLEGFWQLADTSGSTATDSSGHSSNGGAITTSGVTKSKPGIPALGSSDSMLFSGSSTTGYICVTACPTTSGGTATTGTYENIGNANYTITAWIKTTSVTSGQVQMIFTKDESTGGSASNFEVRLSGTGTSDTLQMVAPAGAIGASVTGLVANTWYMVVAEYTYTSGTTGTYSIYVNGGGGFTEGTGSAAEESAALTTYPPMIGQRDDLGAYTFQGYMADVTIWTGTLTPTWMTNLFNAGD